ncbi:hypothetical protein BN439_0045 [Erwinia amylovora Ea644]|nr:hypothetical protein BN439_0045 [Erwinia amylovora Ea644]CCP05126.1 hypothetical protein BN440_0060 [Erwinia amylovora MR1]
MPGCEVERDGSRPVGALLRVGDLTCTHGLQD